MSRDFAKWRTSIKTSRMSPRTDLKVILKFSPNSELLCGAWLLKSFQHREGQRILSYSRSMCKVYETVDFTLIDSQLSDIE